MNRKNIVALFLIVCIVFINIEIKVQAEVIDGIRRFHLATLHITMMQYFFGLVRKKRGIYIMLFYIALI